MNILCIRNINNLPNLETFLLYPHKWKGYTLCEHKMYEIRKNER